MSIYKIGRNLNSQSSSSIIELVNVQKHLPDLRSKYPDDYKLDVNWVLERLDASSNLTEESIAKAPFPGTDVTNSDSERAAKIADVWRAYPKVGLQLWIDETGSGYIPKGQPIVFQNTPYQFPIPLVSPYLSATGTIYLLGEKSRIGIQILGGSNYYPIKGTDYITITGAIRADVTATKSDNMPIREWLPLNKVLPANTPVKISGAKSQRRAFNVQNSGVNNIWVGWGSQINVNYGNLLDPGGNYSMESGATYSQSEFWAFSPEVDGSISGQEGLI